MRRIDHDDVDAGRRERGGLRGHIPVDAQSGRHAQATGAIEGRRIQGGAQRALAAQRSDHGAVVQHGRELESGLDHEVERGTRAVDVVGVKRGEGSGEQVAERCLREGASEPLGGHRTEVLTRGVGEHDAVALEGGQLPKRGRHGVGREQR